MLLLQRGPLGQQTPSTDRYLLIHGMTGALVAVAGGLLLDIPALLLGVLDLSTHLLRHSPADLLLVSLDIITI